MRPNTLAEVVERIRLVASQDVTLAEFVDTFDLAPTVDARYLDSPWHTSSIFIDWTREFMTDAMREYLTFASPAEFASRNTFTEERPLRRARGPQPAKT
jgi:hypothetical protein